MFETRNQAIGFAQRTRKNLMLVRQVQETKDGQYDFHLVTHLVNSLLGLVVHPIERHPKHALWKVKLEDLGEEWPKWNKLLDERGGAGKKWTETQTLERLVIHLRNAAAHGKFTFTGEPDSRDLSKVTLIVEDFPLRCKTANWRFEIGGEELYRFCLLLAERIEDGLG